MHQRNHGFTDKSSFVGDHELVVRSLEPVHEVRLKKKLMPSLPCSRHLMSEKYLVRFSSTRWKEKISLLLNEFVSPQATQLSIKVESKNSRVILAKET